MIESIFCSLTNDDICDFNISVFNVSNNIENFALAQSMS